MSNKIRLFIIECVDPMDLLQRRSEAQALKQVCDIIGHESAILNAYSKGDFKKYCKYISSIGSEHDEKNRESIPLCIHISSHGSDDGISLGTDFIEWGDLYTLMRPLFTELDYYDGNVFITISACMAGNQKLGNKIESQWRGSKNIVPPQYIFVTSNENGVNWDDALVSWTLFYHKISSFNLDRRSTVRSILNKIRAAVGTELRYFRWDTKRGKYLRYTSKSR